MPSPQNNHLTMQEAQAYLKKNGIDWPLSYMKMQISSGRIKSSNKHGPRAIFRDDLVRMINERKSKSPT